MVALLAYDTLAQILGRGVCSKYKDILSKVKFGPMWDGPIWNGPKHSVSNCTWQNWDQLGFGPKWIDQQVFEPKCDVASRLSSNNLEFAKN